ncbi:hypothetical protein EJ06DRAFT_285806 [Trichodelitschia bisporula]|uniref:Secreted protein n=1 Tax=Trichodelitschia bisporula TaxID=703511 RepID=A0A6G1I627_9PEZI|nr:hypothetical protein EJ06DRAFT_285806 [Trichodelitschia bisporula]
MPSLRLCSLFFLFFQVLSHLLLSLLPVRLLSEADTREVRLRAIPCPALRHEITIVGKSVLGKADVPSDREHDHFAPAILLQLSAQLLSIR